MSIPTALNDPRNAPEQSSASKDTGCCGCISFVLLWFVAWALIFGVTVDGKHYGVSGCDAAHGVKVDR